MNCFLREAIAAKQIMVEVMTMCVSGGMGAAALFEVA